MIGQLKRLIELNNLASAEPEKSTEKIIAFSSGKGGTGKTVLSLNIAYALSLLNKKVLLIDLDLNFSNVNIILNTVASKTLYGFFSGKNLLPELITKHTENLHFIFGDSGKNNYPSLSPESIDYFFSQLNKVSSYYDFVILDTGPGEGAVPFLINSDFNIIVSSPEPTAVMDSYVILKLLKGKKTGQKKFIIINKCEGKEEAETAFNNLQSASNHFLKEDLTLLGYIEFSAEVHKSIVTQELLAEKNPLCKAGEQFFYLAEKLSKTSQLANIKQLHSFVL